MVKVSEITNIQLLKQIQKYNKILEQLHKERDKRRARGEPGAELFSPQELAQMRAKSSAPKSKPQAQSSGHQQEAKSKDDFSSPELSASDVQLEIDVEEIERLRSEEEKAKKSSDEDTEEVRVTQLLQLSKDQIAELKKSKK